MATCVWLEQVISKMCTFGGKSRVILATVPECRISYIELASLAPSILF